MNAVSLKSWKNRELEKAASLASQLKGCERVSIRQMYPEFTLEPPYTTSLDPYMPLPALLPFFRTVLVGVLPTLRSEEAFRSHYGVSSNELLALHRSGRVQVRVLFPRSTSTVPKFLDPFFDESETIPSTERDRQFCLLALGDEGERVRKYYAATVGGHVPQSIDRTEASRARKFRISEAAFMQLWALGYRNACEEFCRMYSQRPALALDFLEGCRLFLVGPVHYSLEGIHCVASSAPQLPLTQPAAGDVQTLDVNLGVTLAERLPLYVRQAKRLDVDTALEIYPDYEKARLALMSLQDAVRGGEFPAVRRSCDVVEDTLRAAQKARAESVLALEVLVAVGAALGTYPVAGVKGALLSAITAAAGIALGPGVRTLLTPVSDCAIRLKHNSHVITVLTLVEDVGRWHASLSS